MQPTLGTFSGSHSIIAVCNSCMQFDTFSSRQMRFEARRGCEDGVKNFGKDTMYHRVSFTFGMNGPCVGTDTACSSSLVAGHLAHLSIMNTEATSAIAAGVNAILSSLTTVAICQLQVYELQHPKEMNIFRHGFPMRLIGTTAVSWPTL